MDQRVAQEQLSEDPSVLRRLRINMIADRVFAGATRFFAIFVTGIVLAILISLIEGAMPVLKKFGLGFFISDAWNPVTDTYGALVPIVGTLVTSSHCDADRRSGELRHRAVHHRIGAGLAQAPYRHGG